jgi:hypothetical protein
MDATCIDISSADKKLGFRHTRPISAWCAASHDYTISPPISDGEQATGGIARYQVTLST